MGDTSQHQSSLRRKLLMQNFNPQLKGLMGVSDFSRLNRSCSGKIFATKRNPSWRQRHVKYLLIHSTVSLSSTHTNNWRESIKGLACTKCWPKGIQDYTVCFAPVRVVLRCSSKRWSASTHQGSPLATPWRQGSLYPSMTTPSWVRITWSPWHVLLSSFC